MSILVQSCSNSYLIQGDKTWHGNQLRKYSTIYKILNDCQNKSINRRKCFLVVWYSADPIPGEQLNHHPDPETQWIFLLMTAIHRPVRVQGHFCTIQVRIRSLRWSFSKHFRSSSRPRSERRGPWFWCFHIVRRVRWEIVRTIGPLFGNPNFLFMKNNFSFTRYYSNVFRTRLGWISIQFNSHLISFLTFIRKRCKFGGNCSWVLF